MIRALRTLLPAAALAAATAAVAASDTKDIVLDRVLSPVVTVTPAAPASTDAMVVSVLLESADGSLTPKSTETLFQTGDRFRVKLITSRDAKISLYNTNPKGETNPVPVWQGEARVGLETITPRLALTGNSGVDQLHVVMQPLVPDAGVLAWVSNWVRSFKDGTSKDIRLDVQSTPTATYLLNAGGQGLVSTVKIVHTR